MILSFNTFIFTGLGLLASAIVLGALALGLALRGLGRAREVAELADQALAELAATVTALEQAQAEIRTLRTAHDRAVATPARPSLRQAVALARHGASTAEIVAACRIGQSEARLIQMLYPVPAEAAAVSGAGDELH